VIGLPLKWIIKDVIPDYQEFKLHLQMNNSVESILQLAKSYIKYISAQK